MLFHRTLNANHSNVRRWRTWATTVKRAVAKTNGFLICPCKNVERVAMLLLQGKDERVILCEWKQMGSALAAVDCSAASCEGAVREKAELMELCARYMIPPGPSSLSCPPWEKEKVVVLVAEEQVVGKWTVKACLSAQAVLENLHAGGVGARAPPASYVQWVGKRWVYVTIADCGTNILKCWVNHLCISRIRLTAVAFMSSYKWTAIAFDCTEKDRVCGTTWIMLSCIHAYILWIVVG